MSGGEEGEIRRWRVEDGRETGTPMNAGHAVFNVAVSQDEKWVVSGTRSGFVTMWNAESYSKAIELKAHNDCVTDGSWSGVGCSRSGVILERGVSASER